MNSIRSILSNLKKADYDFSLIKNNDRILLHIEPSFASLALYNALNSYVYYSKKKYTIIPVFLDYGYDEDSLSILQEKINGLKIVDSSEIRDNIQARGKDATKSAWSKLERKKLIELAKEYRCKSIALPALHEDSLNHLYRTMMFEGKISSLRPKASVAGTHISFIRPLLYCYQENIDRYQKELEINVKPTENPYAYTQDSKLNDFLTSVYEENSFAKDNIRKALSDECPDLYKDYKVTTLGNIEIKKDFSVKDKNLYKIYKNHVFVGTICYLFIDNHLVRISYSKMDDETLITSLRNILNSIIENTPRLTICFSRANKRVVSEFKLTKTLIRGKTFFAIKINRQ